MKTGRSIASVPMTESRLEQEEVFGCSRIRCRVVRVKCCYLMVTTICQAKANWETTAIMKNSLFASSFSSLTRLGSLRVASRPRICPKCKKPSPFQQRYAHNPADEPYFESIVDNPPVLVKSGQKHGPGLIVLSRSTGHFCPY